MKKLVVVALFLFAALAVAQQMPRRGAMMAGSGPGAAAMPPQPTALKEALVLTDDQVTRLQSMRKEQADANAASFQLIREKQKLLDDTLKAGGGSAAALGQLLLDIDAAKRGIQDIDKKYHTLALAVLTADQTTKLAQLEAALKLQPAAQQAIGLNLIQGIAGPGPGPGRMQGPPMAPPE
jgi:hypothetical protein